MNTKKNSHRTWEKSREERKREIYKNHQKEEKLLSEIGSEAGKIRKIQQFSTDKACEKDQNTKERRKIYASMLWLTKKRNEKNHPLCRVAKCILDKAFPPDFGHFCLFKGQNKKNN